MCGAPPRRPTGDLEPPPGDDEPAEPEPAAAGEPGLKLESARQVSAPWAAGGAAAAGAGAPAVTRKVFFDLEQDGKPLGRVVLGL